MKLLYIFKINKLTLKDIIYKIVKYNPFYPVSNDFEQGSNKYNNITSI